MSELDDLRTQNKELKRLLGNALDLLEKSKLALTKQAKSKGVSRTSRKKPTKKS